MQTKFKTVITSDHKLLELHLKEVFDYKDLIKLTVKRDFTALYKQTILGPAWAIIQPLFTTVVFVVVFGSLAKLTTADINGDYIIPGFLFYMAGNICWSYFSATVDRVSNVFINNSYIMEKVYFPRLVTPLATALSKLISFAIQLVLFTICWLFFLVKGGTSIAITSKLLLLPLAVVEMVIFSVGIGLIISSATTKYRDLTFAISFCLQLWQYASPVAYGLTLIPEKVMTIYMLNPMSSIITTFRYSIFGFGYFNIYYYLIGWLITTIVFVIGVILFSKIERTFADTI